jgi:hypothetical protein
VGPNVVKPSHRPVMLNFFQCLAFGFRYACKHKKDAGSIRHIWMAINSPSQFHLRELVLRMYWDGEN